MRELSLFTGAGGGVYGSKLLGWKTVGYVEFNDYCQKVIAQRIKDGIFDEAPIFGDVRTFVSDGYARRYRGLVDVISGGFPCQPFSVAGKRQASGDSRNMWPATMDVIKAVKPSVVCFENVPGLLSASETFCGCCGQNAWESRVDLCWSDQYAGSYCGVCQTAMDAQSNESVFYFGTILRDLAESGYDVKWCVLGADDVGAPHHRKRLCILGVHADARHDGSLSAAKSRGEREEIFEGRHESEQVIAGQSARMDTPGNVADTSGNRLERSRQERQITRPARLRNRTRSHKKQNVFDYRPDKSNYWKIEPVLGRVANGVADRSHRLKAIGNGQVSLSMACAYEILLNEFIKELN